MLYRLTEEAKKLPISREQAQDYLKSHRDENPTLDLMLRAAVQHAEHYTGVDFRANTWELLLDVFPTVDSIVLQRSIIASVAVSYLVWDDVDTNDPTTFAADQYQLVQLEDCSEIVLRPKGITGSPAMGVWPADLSQQQPRHGITITMTMGVPPFIEQAKEGILHLLAALWTNRGDALTALQSGGKVALCQDLGRQSGAHTLLDFCAIPQI